MAETHAMAALRMVRLTKVQERLAEDELDALLLTHLKNIRYLSGFEGTTGLLLVTQADPVLFVDPRYAEQAQLETSGVTIRATPGNVLMTAIDYLKSAALRRVGFEAAHITYLDFTRLQSSLGDPRLRPTQGWVERLRAIKDESEITALRRAVDIADAAYAACLQWLRPGMIEREVAARLEFSQRQLGGDRKASETVVASGPRTAFVDGFATDRMIQPDEPVMIDIGAVVAGYTSDLTRNIHLGPAPGHYKQIYSIVREAQALVEERIRPGMRASDIDVIGRTHIAERGYGAYFSHVLGHAVGLDIHEKPFFAGSDDTVIEPGMVMTVEPGIYLPQVFGMRLEDMVLITPTGCEVLTRSGQELATL